MNINENLSNDSYSDLSSIIENSRSATGLLDWMATQIQTNYGLGNENEYSQPIYDTITFIRERYNEDITLQRLAKEIYLSPSYLGKMFRKETGYKITNWINGYRIQKAMELLQSTNIKTYEIANKVGFSSYKYFSIYFLKYAGCSARDFRKRSV